MSRRRRLISTLLLVALVALAGCSGAGNGGGDSTSLSGGDGGAVDTGAEPQEERAADGGDGGGSGDAAGAGDGGVGGQVQDRAIIRTGSAEIEVRDFDAARRNLTAAVERRGGYVSDTEEEVHRRGNETFTTGRIVVRVPRENFSAMMDAMRTEGTVLRQETNSQDVTDQLVDLEARLSNLRAERDRLRELYRNASDTEDVLAVERRLSDVQGEIERIEAQKQNLEDRVAYSRITISLREPEPDYEYTPPSQWYDTPVVAAFLESVNGVVVVARALVVGTAYVLPYVLAFATPLALVVGGFVFWRRR